MTKIRHPGQQFSRSTLGLRWKRFCGHRAGVASLSVLVLLVLFCLAAVPFQEYSHVDAITPNLFARLQGPSEQHWLGTDELGRDELLRLMYAGQASLLVGFLSTVIGGGFGLGIGLLAGYAGGRLDSILMRFTDGVIALPLLPLLIVLGASDLTKIGLPSDIAYSEAAGFWRIILIISIVDWTLVARVVRAATLSVKDRDYVLIAEASGAGPLYLVMVHILPNIAAPVIVALTLTVGRAILLESTISFFGFGVVPPTASWGSMLSNAQELVTSAPALAIYPGVLIFLTVIAINLLGDALQHALDPRSAPHGKYIV